MKKTAKLSKIAILVVAVLSILACIVIPACATEGASDGSASVETLAVTELYVDADGNELDLTVYDDAKTYLDAYTTNKEFDDNFDQNVKIAKDTVKAETPLFGEFWALLPPIIAILLALITKEVYSSLFQQ